MFQLFQLFLFLHVLTAIVAFGPSFAFPIVGAMGGKEPQHANFGTRVSYAISTRMVIPLALTMPISGVLIIWSSSLDFWAARWLLVAIVLYVVAIGYSVFVQLPAVREVIELTSRPPVPTAAGSGGSPDLTAGSPAGPSGDTSPASTPGPPPGGPPPAIRTAVRKVQRGGFLMMGLVVAIAALMVVRPSF